MNDTSTSDNTPTVKTNGWKTFGIIVIVLAIITVVFFIIKDYLFPNAFKPVTLSAKETQSLNQKLLSLNLPGLSTQPKSATNNTTTAAGTHITPAPLEPQAYSEKGASREVNFSEKEINAIIAHNTDMADKLAIDLSNNLASARLLLPLDPDLPMFGGKTLKLNAGIEIAFRHSRPIVKLKGVSAWGVPVPNAWLGNLKNVDLINEFGGREGFWKSFADGIEYVNVTEGQLNIKLKE